MKNEQKAPRRVPFHRRPDDGFEASVVRFVDILIYNHSFIHLKKKSLIPSHHFSLNALFKKKINKKFFNVHRPGESFV